MRREAGFTLVEILIVLAIMSVLMGAVALIIGVATDKSETLETRRIITQISGSLTVAENPDNFGEFPPTNTADLRVGRKKIGMEMGVSNNVCLGIETVAIVIFFKDFDIPRIDTKYLINCDEDEATNSFTVHTKPDFFEIRDAWEQPLVYINHRDYEAATAEPVETRNFRGEAVFVKPRMNPTTGNFFKPDTYQIFSLGPDGEFDTEDDISNFD